MAVHREKHVSGPTRLCHDMAHELTELRRHAVAGSVRQVHHGGAGLDHGLDGFDQVIDARSAGIFG